MLESHGNISILLSEVHDSPLNFTDLVLNVRRHAQSRQTNALSVIAILAKTD